MNLIAILTKLLLYPFAATLVSLAIHGARAEVTLGSAESVGRIGIELDADYCLLSCLTLFELPLTEIGETVGNLAWGLEIISLV